MKASELIRKLRKKIDQYGDCETGITFVGSRTYEIPMEGRFEKVRRIDVQ